jgi:hypothetical protein
MPMDVGSPLERGTTPMNEMWETALELARDVSANLTPPAIEGTEALVALGRLRSLFERQEAVIEAAQHLAWRHSYTDGGDEAELALFYALAALGDKKLQFHWQCPRCGAFHPNSEAHCPCELGDSDA